MFLKALCIDHPMGMTICNKKIYRLVNNKENPKSYKAYSYT